MNFYMVYQVHSYDIDCRYVQTVKCYNYDNTVSNRPENEEIDKGVRCCIDDGDETTVNCTATDNEVIKLSDIFWDTNL